MGPQPPLGAQPVWNETHLGGRKQMLNSYVWVIIFNLPPNNDQNLFYLPNNLVLVILQGPLESLLYCLRLEEEEKKKKTIHYQQISAISILSITGRFVASDWSHTRFALPY